jgi:hypothetical protein
MACIDINSSEKWSLACQRSSCVLKVGDVLKRMEWNNSVIVVSRRKHHSWVDLCLNVVNWREFDLIIDVSLAFLSISIVSTPLVSASEFLETKHVGDRDLGDCPGKKLRSLVCTYSH